MTLTVTEDPLRGAAGRRPPPRRRDVLARTVTVNTPPAAGFTFAPANPLAGHAA